MKKFVGIWLDHKKALVVYLLNNQPYTAGNQEMIERIEVVRGPQSALYGSQAVGGVINVITRRGAGDVAAVERERASIDPIEPRHGPQQ